MNTNLRSAILIDDALMECMAVLKTFKIDLVKPKADFTQVLTSLLTKQKNQLQNDLKSGLISSKKQKLFHYVIASMQDILLAFSQKKPTSKDAVFKLAKKCIDQKKAEAAKRLSLREQS